MFQDRTVPVVRLLASRCIRDPSVDGILITLLLYYELSGGRASLIQYITYTHSIRKIAIRGQ